MVSLPSSILPTFRSALQSFAASTSTIRILSTVPNPPPSSSSSSSPTSSHLLVLDSSFNPPTKAHLHLAASALRHQAATIQSSSSFSPSASRPRRLLLLLATQNAIKTTKPAAFEHRLAMMTIFAHDLIDVLQSNRSHGEKDGKEREEVVVDVGITKHPFFIDKATSISSFYAQSNDGNNHGGDIDTGPEQTHITGFDTLLRILDPKYYAPSHTLAPLETLFSKHRLLVAYRADDEWGTEEEQNTRVQRLSEEGKGGKGWRAEWAERIEMLEGRNKEGEVVSSTRAREAAKVGDKEALGGVCSEGVVEWILREGLYRAGEGKT